MDNELQRYEIYASGIKRLSLLAGLWPERTNSRLYRMVAFVHGFTSIITLSGILCFIASNIKNISLVTKHFGIAVGFSTTILKLVFFTIYRHHLAEMHEALEKSFRSDLKNPEYRTVLLSPLELFFGPAVWLTLTTFGIVIIYNIVPVFTFITQLARGVEIHQRRTPFPTRYPFLQTDDLYATLYIIEGWASVAITSITASTDTLFGYYIFQLASQFRVLSKRILNLNESDDFRSVIKECILRRQLLADCRDKLQAIYGPIILWIMTTSAIGLCANVFQASQISMNRAALVFVYIFMKLTQTLLYAWYGMFLTIESEAFRESIYYSGWPDSADKSFLSNIPMLLMCKPIVLEACHFSAVSLDMFVMIMNTTISYFFLLRTLDEK